MSKSIGDFLDAHHAAQVAFLGELVKVPSDNPPGDCLPHAARATALLEGLGFTVEQHRVPDETVRAVGMKQATNLIVRHRFGDGPVIALNAHGDVVPPGEGWTKDPYGAEIVDGWMYGRGVAVSKSDFATYVYALLALIETGASLRGTVELHLTYDEEAGGVIGPKWLLDEGLSKPDYVLSAGFSYGVVTAHNGCLHLEVTINGLSAHAARPVNGHDALEAANGVLSALYELRKGYGAVQSQITGIGSPSLVVGLIQGGINTNVVPDKVSFRLDRRMIPEENPAEVEAVLRREIEAAASVWPGITCEVAQILLSEPLKATAQSEKLAGIFCRHASAVFGETVEMHGVPLYTDARHYAAVGIPTVLYGAGPRSIEEANAHRADERLPLADLRRATEVVALAIGEVLG